MAVESTINLKFQVKDDGSVVLDKIGAKLDDTGRRAEGMNRSLSIIKWDAIVNLGERAFQTGGQIYNMAKQAGATGDEIQRQAKILDMTTTEYQKLQYVAMRVDVETTALATGMKILSKNMLEAAEESREQTKVFEMLGVQVKDQEGKLKSYDQILGDLADTFQRMADGPEKVALALQVFGRSGEAMIPLLNKGRQGIEEFREEFEKLGINIDPGTIEKLAKADEQFEKFEARMKTVKQLVLTPVVEEVGKLLEVFLKLNDLISKISKGENISQALSKTFGNREEFLKARKELGWLTEKEGEELEKMEISKIPAAAWVKEWAAAYKPALKLSEEAANLMARDSDRWKKWVEEFDGVEYALQQLGITSTATLTKTAEQAVSYADVIKNAFQEGKVSVADYVNVLKAAENALKKLVGEDVTAKLAEGTSDLEKAMKEVSWEDPDRQKKINALIDNWLEARKQIQEAMNIAVHADIAPAEREINELIAKAQAQGIVIPVTTSGGGTAETGGGATWKNYVKEKTEFFNGGKKAVEEMNDSFQDWSDQWGEGLDVPISFYGIGSTKIPITEKIREIMDQFGGLQNVLSSLEVKINLSDLTAELKTLQSKLEQIRQIPGEILRSGMGTGSANRMLFPSAETEAWVREQEQELNRLIKIIKMKQEYEILRIYGGYQTGTSYVPRTGPYILHEGEQVLQRNVRTGPIQIIIQGAREPRSIADELVKTLKYRLNTELRDLLK